MIIFFKFCILSFLSFSTFFIIKKFFNYLNNNCYNSNNKKKPIEFGVIINENELININQSEDLPLNTDYLSPPPSPPPDDSSSTPIMRHYYNADRFEDYDSCA